MFYIILIILVELALFATNYIHGTYLLGWDNIMPEFNLLLNLKRAFFGVWQEYRGLGLFDGMAHTANLMHTVYIAFLSLFLPQSMVRYVFIHLTHLAGGLGMFFLLRYILASQGDALQGYQTLNHKPEARSHKLAAIVPFLAALFYMLNLGVIQMYYAPLEAFSVHFATLPILALLTLKALNKPGKKNLLILLLGSFLLTPQNFVPTFFLVFLVLFSSLLFFNYLKTRNLKNIIVICFIVFAANAFWLLPYISSASQNAKVVTHAKINELSSEEVFYMNQDKGNLPDVLFLKGFMLDSTELDLPTGSSLYLMNEWRNYQKTLPYLLSYLLILIIGFGGLLTILKKRKKEFYPFVLTFGLSFFFLANNTPILLQLNELIRNLFPVFGEIFRFSFTKFIILFAFSLSIFIAVGVNELLLLLKFKNFGFENSLKISNLKLKIGLVIFMCSLLLISLPAFKGNFTSPLLKVNLPNDYLEAFKFFDSLDENQRVAVFPMQTFWNWQYRSWPASPTSSPRGEQGGGQRGSGFLWYGIKQPITERAFDPWNNYDEQFYNEMSNAVKTDDKTAFSALLKKYDVKYILIDQYLVEALSKQAIDYRTFLDFFDRNPYLEKKTEIGKLVIYETVFPDSFVYYLDKNKTFKTQASYQNETEDVFLNKGDYVLDKNNFDVRTVFPSLYTNKLQEDLEFNFQDSQDKIIFQPKNINLTGTNLILEIPSLFDKEFLIPVEAKIEKKQIILSVLTPKIFINHQEVALQKEKIILSPKKIFNPVSLEFGDTEQTIDLSSNNLKGYLLNNYPNSIKIKDENNHEEIFTIDTAKIQKINSAMQNSIPINIGKIDSIEVEIDKFQSPLSSFDIIKNGQYQVKENYYKLPSSAVKPSLSSFQNQNSVNFKTENSSLELVFAKDNLFHEGTYALTATTRYQSGLPINFYVDNPFRVRAEIETRLSKTKSQNLIILPKTEDHYKGYGFHFLVKSLGQEIAQSSIESISLWPLPLETMKNIKITTTNKVPSGSEKIPVEFTKTGNFLYKIDKTPSSPGYLVLSQAFDNGWKAYKIEIKNQKSKIKNTLMTFLPFFFGEELKDHVLVNNWANGWTVNDNYTLAIVFWPQYLEFAGFGLLFLTFGICLCSALYTRLSVCPRKYPTLGFF